MDDSFAPSASKGTSRNVSGSSAYGYSRRPSNSTVRTLRAQEEMEEGDEEELYRQGRSRRGTFAERLLLGPFPFLFFSSSWSLPFFDLRFVSF